MRVGDLGFLRHRSSVPYTVHSDKQVSRDLSPSRQYSKELLSNIVAIQNLDLSDHTVNDIEYQHPLGRGQCHIPVTWP